jgi:hypothetical protein
LDLIGQYVSILMTRHEIAAAIGAARSVADSGDKDFAVTGRIAGETPGVGLWIEIDGVLDITRDDVKDAMPAITKIVRPRLVRWEFISNATVYREKPTRTEIVGFRPR